MSSEDETFDELAIGHLLKRQNEISEILNNVQVSDLPITTIPKFLNELTEINSKIVEYNNRKNYLG